MKLDPPKGWRLRGAGPIFVAMPFPRPASPKAVLADLRALLAERSRHQVVAAIAAIFMPVAIITGFWVDSTRDHDPGEQIIYVKSWSAKRTDAEIIADQNKAQAEKEALQKERQRQWQRLDQKLERIGI